jgi:phage terminase small subunit
MPTVIRKIFTEETEEQLLKMERDEVTELMTDKQQKFCEEYIRNYNIKLAAIKAGYSNVSAHIVGWKLRQRPDVNRYIAWLKLRVCRDCHISAMDIIDKYARIAFSDMTDFVKIEGNRIKLYDGKEIDGQLIQKVRQGAGGVSIELYDKLSALDKLERYLDVMPSDWRQKIEEKKVEIMQQRLDFDKAQAGQSDEEIEDDGFIEAIRGSAKEVWNSDGSDDNG